MSSKLLSLKGIYNSLFIAYTTPVVHNPRGRSPTQINSPRKFARILMNDGGCIFNILNFLPGRFISDDSFSLKFDLNMVSKTGDQMLNKARLQ